MTDALEEIINEIFIYQIKSALVAIRKTSQGPDRKGIFNYITSKYASSTTKPTIADCINNITIAKCT